MRPGRRDAEPERIASSATLISTPIDRPAPQARSLFRDSIRNCLAVRALQLFIGQNEPSNVAQGLFPQRHLLQVILPEIVRGGARCSAREGLALDRDDVPVAIEPRVLARRQQKRNLRALFPEVRGEFVREKQSVVPMAVLKGVYSLLHALPFGLDGFLVPCPEMKTMSAGALNDME